MLRGQGTQRGDAAVGSQLVQVHGRQRRATGGISSCCHRLPAKESLPLTSSGTGHAVLGARQCTVLAQWDVLTNGENGD